MQYISLYKDRLPFKPKTNIKPMKILMGMGFIIEKEFQGGRKVLTEAGVKHIESLAIIESLENNQIKLKGV